MMKRYPIFRFENGNIIRLEDYVVEENLLNIFVNDEFVDSIFYSNGEEFLLSLGFLFVNGIIMHKGDIKGFKYVGNEFSKNYYFEVEKNSSSFFDDGKPISIDSNRLFSLMKELLSYSKVFAITGGTHIVGIANGEGVMSYFEDISRLSATLKNVGFIIDREIKEKVILLTSGRINFNIVEIAKQAHIPLIVSQSAVSTLAINEAKDNDIALIGFLRGNRFNIYTSSSQILLK